MTITQQGIAATSQTLASQAGAQILARGGSAVDAAIAANAVLAVTEPMTNGPGGDLLVLYWDAKTGKLIGLNASGSAPRALTPDFLAKQNVKTMPARRVCLKKDRGTRLPASSGGWKDLRRPVARRRSCGSGLEGALCTARCCWH